MALAKSELFAKIYSIDINKKLIGDMARIQKREEVAPPFWLPPCFSQISNRNMVDNAGSKSIDYWFRANWM